MSSKSPFSNPTSKSETHDTLNKLLASHGFVDKLLSHKEAAKLLGVGIDTLYCWVSSKRYSLPRVKVGKLNKFWLSDLIRFLNERTIGGERP